MKVTEIECLQISSSSILVFFVIQLLTTPSQLPLRKQKKDVRLFIEFILKNLPFLDLS